MPDPPTAPWLAANLEALAAVLGVAIDVRGSERWQITAAPDGPVLQLRTAAGGLVAAHSRRQPAAEAGRLVDAALGGRPCPPFAMVIGAGFGGVVEDLFRRDPAVRVLVVEPDASGAAAFLGQRDWTGAIGTARLLVLSGPDYRGAERAWRFVPTSDLAPLIVVHPVLAREYPDDIRRAAAVGTRVVADARANAGAESTLAAPYLLNTIANLGVVAHEGDVDALAGAFDGVPAIVVAAGPSLDRVVADLARLQDRALVIAVDTALRPLLAQGVAPHFAVAVDPSERNARHLSNLDDAGATWLVAEPGVDPNAFPTFAGRTFTFRVGDNHPWPWLAARGVTRGVLAAWGSVLVSALDLAVRVGAGPIAIVGADLAYTGRQPYCRGTAFEEDWAREVRVGERLDAVWSRVANRPGAHEQPDLDGRPTPTLPHLVAFRDRLLDQAAASGVRIVNATGGGILFGRGLEIASLDGVLADARGTGDLRARIRERHGSRPTGADAAALTTALAHPGTVDALGALVAGVDGTRITAAMTQARHTLTKPPPAAPVAATTATPMTAATPDAPVWLPEQTAALAALAAADAVDRAPLPAPLAAPTSVAAVVEAARALVAHDAIVSGSVDAEALAADLLAVPLQLLIPMTPEARHAAERFGAALTRLVAAHRPAATTDEPFWSTPTATIDPPGDIGTVTRTPDELARIAAITTAAWAAARHEGTAPLWRAAEAVARSWPRVTGGAPRTARIDLALARGGDAPISWLAGAPLAPLARGLAGTILRVAPVPPARPGAAVGGTTAAVSLAIASRDGWIPGGHSIVAAPMRLLTPEPCAPCLYGGAIDGGHALISRLDQRGSYVIDAAGDVAPARAWPGPILGEGPLGDGGTWYGWTAQPPRLLVRDRAGSITHDVALPFRPTGAEVDGGGVRFTAVDGLWRWTADRGVEHVFDTAPLIAVGPGTDGTLHLELMPLPVERPLRVRTRTRLIWSPDTGITGVDVPPIGPCWSRTTIDEWTAEGFPDAGLVRISGNGQLRGWVIADYPRTVAWAGGSLVIVTAGGVVLFAPGVRDALR